MNYTQTRWTILPEKPLLQSLLQKELKLSPLLSQLLINRAIIQPDSAKKFLSSSLNDLTPPFLMKDLKKAARRIIEAIYQKEKVFVFGDYDVDGITGTAILKLFLDTQPSPSQRRKQSTHRTPQVYARWLRLGPYRWHRIRLNRQFSFLNRFPMYGNEMDAWELDNFSTGAFLRQNY